MARRNTPAEKCKDCGHFLKAQHTHFCAKVTMVPRICKSCKKSFEIYPSQAKLGEGVYCSKECRATWLRIARLGAVVLAEQIKRQVESSQVNEAVRRVYTCGKYYFDSWGRKRKCKNRKEEGKYSCGMHSLHRHKKRYFQSKHYQHLYLDLYAD